jgi:hypothetical protein
VGKKGLNFRLFFAIIRGMSLGTNSKKCFVVDCKHCRRHIPTGLREFPFQSVVVECSLCGEVRRYLPSEIELGKPHVLVGKRVVSGVGGASGVNKAV